MSEKRDKYYRVGFDTKRGGTMYWNFDINAGTAKQAKEIAKERWYEMEHRTAHMFHIEVERIDEDSLVHCGYFRNIY